MAQTGYTPIQLYYSSTTTNAPTAGNLANGELAINITDGKLFYKDNANAVQVIGWKVTPTTAGGTGLTSYTAGDLPYYATGTTLSKLGIGASTTVITSSGSAPQWTAQSALSVGTASNLLSNATTGKMQIVGPAAASTRVMTIPDANFTAARTDAGQTFTGNQIFTLAGNDANIKVQNSGGGAAGAWYFADSVDLNYMGVVLQSAGVEKWLAGSYGTSAYQIKSGGRSGTEALRVETSNDVKVSVGNLVIGTSGKGIDFSSGNGVISVGNSSYNIYVGGGTFTPAEIYLQSTYAYIQAAYNNTTASAANVFVASTGELKRSTSALKYKQDVRDLEEFDINKFRAVRYKSKCDRDDQTKDHFGLIADEVDAAGISELVIYNEAGEPEGFQYERLSVVLLKKVQMLEQRIAELEKK